jgi:hypothetical protein
MYAGIILRTAELCLGLSTCMYEEASLATATTKFSLGRADQGLTGTLKGGGARGTGLKPRKQDPRIDIRSRRGLEIVRVILNARRTPHTGPVILLLVSDSNFAKGLQLKIHLAMPNAFAF